ncbi:ASCH domain-containing protein [Cohnella sp. REN36]|uniref:ASCH domain-containing protein n=1 Tax=Cohnella sp. REN36 TaxID=2887347 RepID=UPI001D14301F|nr:ASCH domain-containing protein [Cohnella sp. REN36]MCC3372228.1 ASCH domain-containing protein [Cohnella sp. REN36]
MNVLLSIKPEFIDLIVSGEKQYEFRRTIFKRKDVSTIIVYATTPVSRVVGEFEVDYILCKDVNSLWEETKSFAGVDEDFFFNYFNNKEMGYAIKIKNYNQYPEHKKLIDIYQSPPPQSFAYITV